MSILLKQFNKDGKPQTELEVSESVFGLEPNIHVLHLAVRRELANARSGSANCKTRSEVRGGGRKPWKQKGTGRARAGSIRSPLWVGGGVSFGPKPRDFSINLPKKVRSLAIKSSLSSAKTKFHVIEDFSFLKAPKTKEIAGLLKKLEVSGKKILLLVDYKAEENQNIYLAARNIDRLKISLPHNLSVKDILDAEAILATKSAVEEINERYASHV
ncbi:MAG: 50S ribosomal protein L4 [Cyanobacteria bacterium]|jgi:large subunit ribosomal protein L4|nr:50S ribosomal protein L4 [Cyanobacteriota bacterium]